MALDGEPPQATVDEFDAEMGSENPLGDRVDAYAVGQYIVELYESDFMADRGNPNGVVNVFRRTGEDEEYHRTYKQETNQTYDTVSDAKDVVVDLRANPDAVRAFIERHG